MSSDSIGPELRPAGATPVGGIPNLTWDQLISLIATELIRRGYAVPIPPDEPT